MKEELNKVKKQIQSQDGIIQAVVLIFISQEGQKRKDEQRTQLYFVKSQIKGVSTLIQIQYS